MPSRVDWEILGLRARFYAYSIVQLLGFAIIFWGFWEFLLKAVAEKYYPGLTAKAASRIPELDPMTAIIVFSIGAVVVALSTRTS